MEQANRTMIFWLALTIGTGLSKYLDFVYVAGLTIFSLPGIFYRQYKSLKKEIIKISPKF